MTFDMSDSDFMDTFAVVVAAAGIPAPRHTPESLLELWSAFVEKCLLSFPGSIEQYYGSLGVRSVIRKVLWAHELNVYPDIVDFSESVTHIDRRFLGCLDLSRRANIERTRLDDGEAWYWQYFPAQAGDTLIRDLELHYGFRKSL